MMDEKLRLINKMLKYLGLTRPTRSTVDLINSWMQGVSGILVSLSVGTYEYKLDNYGLLNEEYPSISLI